MEISARAREGIAALRRLIWNPTSETTSRRKRALVRALRIGEGVARDITQGQLTLRAMSLVYTTLLAIVPLLAVSFSLLKALGVHNRAEPMLLNYLRPLGELGVDLTEQILEFVERMQVGVLGAVGVALLLWSVLALVQKTEEAFNHSWHITRNRVIWRRFGEFLSLILIGPVLIFSAVGITGSLMSTRVVSRLMEIDVLGVLVRVGGRLLPYVLVIAAFTFIYVFVPNTKVKLRSALAGALLAGVMWQTVGWGFASFVVTSARYSGLYSSFAIMLLLMIWLYLSWLILLIGASTAFYYQHPEYLGIDRRSLLLSSRLRERLALRIMYLVGLHHFDNQPPWSVENLAARLRFPEDAVATVLDALEKQGLLATAGEVAPSYLPARALEIVSLKEVLMAVRTADEGPLLNATRLPPEAIVDEIGARVESAIDGVLGDLTVRDLVVREEPA